MSDSVNPGTVSHQAPLSLGFLGNNTGAGCQFLLQGIFLTQESNPCLLHNQASWEAMVRVLEGTQVVLKERTKDLKNVSNNNEHI